MNCLNVHVEHIQGLSVSVKRLNGLSATVKHACETIEIGSDDFNFSRDFSRDFSTGISIDE